MLDFRPLTVEVKNLLHVYRDEGVREWRGDYDLVDEGVNYSTEFVIDGRLTREELAVPLHEHVSSQVKHPFKIVIAA